jgi:hypothetical protein
MLDTKHSKNKKIGFCRWYIQSTVKTDFLKKKTGGVIPPVFEKNHKIRQKLAELMFGQKKHSKNQFFYFCWFLATNRHVFWLTGRLLDGFWLAFEFKFWFFFIVFKNSGNIMIKN